MDQTYCQNQDNSQRTYHKKGAKNIKKQPTDRISINSLGIQSINGNSFVSFLDNTKTFEMMKFMITVTIKNIKNKELKSKLNKIINNEELVIKNILNTINKEENYNRLVLTLKSLSGRSKTIKKLCQRLEKNPCDFKTKSKSEKPIAVILDNYSVHHAIFFTELCNILNMDLIYLLPYSPKYNPIEQVWRTIKAIISRKYITSMPMLIYLFLTEFKKVVDKSSYWKNWGEKFL